MSFFFGSNLVKKKKKVLFFLLRNANKTSHFQLHTDTYTVYISSFWHVMTWEYLIWAHGFNNAWVRERERGRACTPTRSNCLRNKTEQTSSLRKSLQENKLVTRLTPLTVLLSEAERTIIIIKKKKKNLHCKLASMVVKFFPRLKCISKSQPKPQLTLSLTSGDRRRKGAFLCESWFRLYTQAPQRKINQRHTFIKYTFASLSFVKIFNK